jgi:hypothetical protein
VSQSDKPVPSARRRADVDAFIGAMARLPAAAPSGRGRLLFAIDATASRQPTWDRACRLQAEMFLVARDLGGLEVQLAYYRGFAEFEATRWLAEPEALVRAMAAVRCLGGETQIARVLAHARVELTRGRVDAVVFVGDCMEEDADHLCRAAGELGLLGVPLFIFHEGGEAVAAATFRQMAKASGGAYCPFDAASADQLRDLLRAVAVFAAGGRAALESHARGAAGAARAMLAQLRLLGPSREGPPDRR